MKHPILSTWLLLFIPYLAMGQLNYGRMADSLAGIGQPDKTIPLLEKAYTTHPRDESLLRELGKQYLIRNNLDMGEKYYWKALSLNSSCGDCYVNLGIVFYQRGNMGKAMEYMEKAVAATPDDPQVYRNRGQIREGNGDFKSALEDYNKAISLAPDNVDNYIVRGGFYAESNEPEKAKADFDKAISVAPDDYRGFQRRAMLKLEQLDMDGYCADFHTAYKVKLQTEPGSEILPFLRERLEEECDSSKVEYYRTNGLVYEDHNKLDRALAIYEKGLQKFPNHPMLLFYKGNANFRMNKYAAALTCYNNGLKDKSALTAYLESYRSRNEKAGSLETLTQGFMGGLYLYMAECYFATGQYDSAIVAANSGMVLAPEAGPGQFVKETFYNIRGNIYLAQHNYQAAVKDFDKCIALNPQYAPAYANRALAKINMAKQVNVKYTTISLGKNRDEFQPAWRLPVKMKSSTKEIDENMAAALGDANKAIDLDGGQELAFYLRGHLKKLMNLNGACDDFVKAKKLGYEVEGELVVGCGN